MKSVILLIFCTGLLAGNLVIASDSPEKLTLSLPGLKWALEIKAPGFVVKKFSIASNGHATYFQASNDKTGVIMSAFLEKTGGPYTPQACRKYYWSRTEKSPFKKTGIKKSESGNMALVEYTISQKYKDMDLTQHNLNAYMAEPGYWIDIHLSKTNFKTGDGKLFRNVLANVSISKNFKPNTLVLFRFANFYFSEHKYGKSAIYYRKALDRLNVEKEYPKEFRLVITDMLGMSYGISGDLKNAEKLYKTAIKQEPEYPQYYYNLACVYAQKNNLNATIKNLQLAFKYRKNMLPGRILCDPKKDSSFRKFLENPKFKAALKQMEQDK